MNNISLYLSRILSGFYYFILNNQQYKLVYPDISVRYEAELYAENERENNKFNEWLTDEDILYHLIEYGLWTPGGDDALKTLEKQIEDQKVALYQSILNPPQTKMIRRHLEGSKKSYNRLYGTRHSFDHLTLNGYIDNVKNQFLLTYSIYDDNNKRVFQDINNIDFDGLTRFSENIASYIINIETFRAIARSDLWRNYWGANKDRVFDKPVINWTDEQKTLVVLTKMYDSAYEHPDCPNDKVIEDDDMFDGWMIYQRRENDKAKDKNRANKILEDKNLGKAQEVFLMAKSNEEAQNIYNLNDNQSRHIIKEREKAISNAGSIEHSHLPDVQRDLMVQSNQQFMQTAKRK